MGMTDAANITVDEARALVSDRAVWPLVRDFLWDFAPQVHPSWIEGLGRETGDERREGEPSAASQVSRLMSSPRVKRFVLDSLGVVPCFHVFPKSDFSRLLLLDGAVLESIVKWLGALACAGELRRVTNGAAVRGLKEALAGVYPQVFSFAAYFPEGTFARVDAPEGGSRPSVVEDVISTGLSIVGSLLAGLPEPVVARLKFKLPKSIDFSSLVSRLSSESPKGRERTRATVAKLLKLKFPEAHKLCC